MGLLERALSIVVPALNEETTVYAVLLEHAAVGHEIVGDAFEMSVCDDGSSDGTWAELERARQAIPQLRLIRHESNRGIAPTVRELYAQASGEWVYFGPADGQVPADALRRMWAAREGAALVVGERVPRRDPVARRVIARLYSWLLRSLFRLPVHDIDSVKLYRRSELQTIAARSTSNFLEAELLIRLCQGRKLIREVVVEHRPRTSGQAKGLTLAAAVAALCDLARFALTHFAGR